MDFKKLCHQIRSAAKEAGCTDDLILRKECCDGMTWYGIMNSRSKIRIMLSSENNQIVCVKKLYLPKPNLTKALFPGWIQEGDIAKIDINECKGKERRKAIFDEIINWSCRELMLESEYPLSVEEKIRVSIQAPDLKNKKTPTFFVSEIKGYSDCGHAMMFDLEYDDRHVEIRIQKRKIVGAMRVGKYLVHNPKGFSAIVNDAVLNDYYAMIN